MNSENISDYLYLILIVVFSIIGALTKKKKNNPVGNGKPTRKPVFETIFEELSDEFEVEEEELFEKKKEPVKVTFAEQVKAINSRHQSVTKTKSPFLEGEKFSSDIKTTQIIDELDLTSENQSIKVSFNDLDDLKKALVYSEILNAKYVS
jgi:hypothetical protein